MSHYDPTHENWLTKKNPARTFVWGRVHDYSDGHGGVVENPKPILLLDSRVGARLEFSNFYDAVSGQKIRVPVTIIRNATVEEIDAARAEFRLRS